MADRMDLEQRLGELASEVEWPPTPDPGPRVRKRIERRFRPRLAILLVAAAIALAFGTQVVVAHNLQLRGATLQSVPGLPTPSASALPTGDAGQRYAPGQRPRTLTEAGRAAGFTPLVPTALGQP